MKCGCSLDVLLGAFRRTKAWSTCGWSKASHIYDHRQLLPTNSNISQQVCSTFDWLITMTTEHQSDTTTGHDDPLADPEERRVLYAAFDSFRYVGHR